MQTVHIPRVVRWLVAGLACASVLSVTPPADAATDSTALNETIPAESAALTGVVQNTAARPLANVIIEAAGHRTTTDANGRFLLTGLSAGTQQVWIDARPASGGGRTYGTFVVGAELQAGKLTEYPQPLWMPALDTRNTVKLSYPLDQDVVVTHPNLPNLEVRLPAGTVVRDREGKLVTEVGITPVPSGRVPFPMVRGYAFNGYYVLQPGGARLEVPDGKAARVIYPNWLKAPPNTLYLLTEYQPRLGYEGWVGIAEAWVDPQGRQIVPAPNAAGITAFNGAGITTGPSPPSEPCKGVDCVPGGGPPDCRTCGDSPDSAGRAPAGDPVSVTTGIFSKSETDIVLPDAYPIVLNRSHVAGDAIDRAFGISTSHNWEIYLWRPDPNFWTELNVIMANGVRVRCPQTGGGSAEGQGIYDCRESPGPLFGAQIRYNSIVNKWDLVLNDGSLYEFGKIGGKLHLIRDRNGNQISVPRNPLDSGNVDKLISPNGRWIAFTYTSNRITQLKDNDGRAWNYTYDAQGRLSTATDPDSKVRTYTYESATSHRMATYQDPRLNVVFANLYWPDGRLKKQTLIDTATFQFAYTIDGQGRVTQTDVTDQRGNVRRVQMNTAGFITSDTFAFGTAIAQTHSFTYQNGTNLLLTSTDGLNRTTAYTYDAFGNTLTTTLMSGTGSATTTTYTYEPVRQQIATSTDALSHTTSFSYDFRGNLTGITDARSQTTILGYNAQGQVSSITDPLTHATSFTYDRGDLATVTDALTRTANVFADSLGRVTAVRDPLGNRTLTSYDVRDRPTVITDPLGGTVQMGYDADNNLLNFRDQRNNLTEFTYDTMNRLKTRKDALLRTETYDYDIAGRLKQITDRKAQVSGFGYDALNRRTSAGFGATTGNPTAYTSTIAYTYDAGNRLTQVVDSVSGTITRQYDARFNTLTQEVAPEGQVDLTYDAAARRATFQVAGQTQLGYTFDAADRLTQIAQGATTVGFGYDNANRRTTLTLPNGIVVEYGYDNANQLTGLTYKNGGTTLGALTYAYDNAGRRTQIAGSYARTNLPTALASATYNVNNQLTNWGGTTLTYDNNGNLLTDGTNTHVWNARDQLASISGGVTASFGYDAFNRRRTKTVAGTKTDFLYDGLNFVQEKDGVTIKANLLTGLGIDEVFRRTQGAVTSDVLPDALGSSVALSDSTKAITTQYTYAPYGTTTQTGPANDNAQKFTGREDDGATGLYYYRARYYSPKFSRFLAEDPIGLAGGPNGYMYVGGNPINARDPTGELLPLLIPILTFSTGFYGTMSYLSSAAEADLAATNAAGANDVYNAAVGACLKYDIGGACNAAQDALARKEIADRNLPAAGNAVKPDKDYKAPTPSKGPSPPPNRTPNNPPRNPIFLPKKCPPGTCCAPGYR